MVPLCRGGRLCPSATALPPLSVGRDPCVPPHDMHVFLPPGHAGPALQGTGRIRADRVVRPNDGSRSRAKRDVVPQGHLFRCAPLRDAVPYERSPYPSVGRDPCVPPHNMHVFLPAGHAGPALQSAAITRRHGRTLCTPSLCNDVLTEKAVHYCAFNLTGSTI